MKKLKFLNSRWFYVVFFLVSFPFFLYQTFPYSIVNQSLTNAVADNTSLDLRINSIEPLLPLGFKGNQVIISSQDRSRRLEFKSVAVRLSVLRLLIGQVAGKAILVDPDDGSAELFVKISLFDLIGGSPLPSSVSLNADKFSIGQIVGLALKLYHEVANDLIKSTLLQINLGAKVDGTLDLDLDYLNPELSTGNLDLKFLDARLDLNDPNLQIEPQIFDKANIIARLDGGILVLDESSGFHSKELKIDTSGSFKLKSPLQNTTLSLNLSLKLSGSINDNFGFLLNVVGGESGSLNYSLGGTLGRPVPRDS